MFQPDLHRQKLVLVWSAMRHFAAELRAEGWEVTYVIADDFLTPLRGWIKAQGITELRIMRPNNRPLAQAIDEFDLPSKLVWVQNNHFYGQLLNLRRGQAVESDSSWREDFYREARKRSQILMVGKKPIVSAGILIKKIVVRPSPV
ncbi:MAG: cryptochrome/photolyase family protein [Cyanobacteria bacterium P01_H01_bin.15]